MGHNTGLYHSLTVKENLLFFSKISGDKNLGINTSIKTWGLEAYQNQTTLNLSQGLSIRAGLARAFLSDAPILLLDEPSANLDDEFKKVLLAELKIHSSKKYIFIATHEPSLFHELSPEVINLCL